MNEYMLVFGAGLLSTIHCVAMCGGLIMACSVRFGGGLPFSFAYNTGRVATYTLLGLAMGLFGKTLASVSLFERFQGLLPTAAGLFMIVIGLDLLGLMPRGFKRLTSGVFPEAVSAALKGRRPPAVLLGMLNGLIPCGLIYAMGVKAASTADPVQGMLVMISFGIGTFVPLLFAGYLTGFMSNIRSGRMMTASAVLIMALGVKSIVHGAGHMHMIF